MKSHPHIRKTIKWAGAAMSVLLLTAWIASGWWSMQWFVSPYWIVNGQSGMVQIVHCPSGCFSEYEHPRVQRARNSYELYNSFWAETFSGPPLETFWNIPLWAPTLAALLLALGAARFDAVARAREHAARRLRCPKCNYDRTGLAKDAVCPECGSSGEVA